eukprot:2458210-Pyramimonas_sp.AAC.1
MSDPSEPSGRNDWRTTPASASTQWPDARARVPRSGAFANRIPLGVALIPSAEGGGEGELTSAVPMHGSPPHRP